jgi:hypothetical protein
LYEFHLYIGGTYYWLIDFIIVLSTTFSNISVISWQSVLLVEETGGPKENQWPVASHRQTLSQNVVSSTPCMNRIWTHNFNCNRYWLHRLIQLPYDHDHDDPLCRIKLNNIINILIIKRNALFFVLVQEKKNNQTYALLVFI